MDAARWPAVPPDAECARCLGISEDAVRLVRGSDVIDLHIDTFIPPRLWGYDVMARHARGPLGGWFFGHLDAPRIAEGGLTGAMWSITTNPFRTAKGRWRVFQKNLARLQRLWAGSGGYLRPVRTLAEYRAARADGAHACLLSIQGGNALEAAPEGVASVPDLTRVTLVHLTSSAYGATSSPFHYLSRRKGLSDAGRDLIRQLNAHRVFVDSAHLHPETFWDAVEVHDRGQPLLATHTGVNGVRRSWRNLDDAQIKAITGTGGTIGVIFAAQFLKRRGGPRDGRMIVEHMQHLIDVAGEDHVSVGSDYDGAITPPPDLRGGDSFPRLVQHMLDAGWAEGRIRKVLGGNFLRVLGMLRPG